MLLKLDNISWAKTLLTKDNFVQWFVANTLFEMNQLQKQKDRFKETWELVLYWKWQPVLNQHFKYGIEIRIKSVSQDDSHSWVRISYGTIKYVIDSIEDNTENTSDPQEE